MTTGGSVALMPRTKEGLVLFVAALLHAVGRAPVRGPVDATVGPWRRTITPDPTPNGCEGVVTTPGSENTNKRLIGGDLDPGRRGDLRDQLPGRCRRRRRRLPDHRLRVHRRRGGAEVLRRLRAEQRELRPRLHVADPHGRPIGEEFCNYAKTTESPVAVAGQQPQGRSRLLHRRRQHHDLQGRTRPAIRSRARSSTSSATSRPRMRSCPSRSSTVRSSTRRRAATSRPT